MRAITTQGITNDLAGGRGVRPRKLPSPEVRRSRRQVAGPYGKENKMMKSSSTNNPLMILDNAHLLAPDTIRGMVQATPNFSWVLLAQPWPGMPLLEAYFGIETYHLCGWSRET